MFLIGLCTKDLNLVSIMTSKATDGASKEHRIKTFVLLSFRATSDEAQRAICMYGISVNGLKSKEISELIEKDDKLPECGSKWQPRVLHKLLLPLNSGLRYKSEQDNYFDKSCAEAVVKFVGHMQQPACLVAHNGYDSHFPLLKQALSNHSLHLPSGTLCADSLPIFLNINDQLKPVPYIQVFDWEMLHKIIKNSCKDREANNHALQANIHSFDPSDSTPSTFDNSAIQRQNETTPERHHSLHPSDSTPSIFHNSATQAQNETTPGLRTKAGVKRRHSPDLSDSTPSTSRNTGSNVRRVLFPSEDQAFDDWQIEKLKVLEYFNAKVFYDRPKRIECAEEDVKSLMELITIYGKHFLDKTEMKAFSFDEVLINTDT